MLETNKMSLLCSAGISMSYTRCLSPHSNLISLLNNETSIALLSPLVALRSCFWVEFSSDCILSLIKCTLLWDKY